MPSTPGALDGLRVIDMATVFAGPGTIPSQGPTLPIGPGVSPSAGAGSVGLGRSSTGSARSMTGPWPGQTVVIPCSPHSAWSRCSEER